MKNQKEPKKKAALALSGALTLILTSGCGQASFAVTSTTQAMKSPGTFTTPPKVDIFLAEDDTGSMDQAFGSVNAEIPTLLTQLQNSGWDYHFATSGLTTYQKITEALASTYDANWGSSWTAPFPGAVAAQLENLAAAVFTLPTNYSGFTYVTPTSADSGFEPGLSNIATELSTGVSGTGFLRPDALLVVMVMGNGDDTSDILYCNRGDGKAVPCEQAPPAFQTKTQCATPDYFGPSGNLVCSSCGTPGVSSSQCGVADATATGMSLSASGWSDVSMAYYQQKLTQLKGTSQLVRFFSATADGENNCLGAPYTGTGSRYKAMSQAFGGTSFTTDICQEPIASALNVLSTELQGVQTSFETNYLFISNQPNPSTIQVTKYPGGNTAAGVTIPQDPNNGWEYVGYVTNVYTINLPVPMNLASGWAIQLNGTAELVGNDTATVTYTQAGLTSSSTTN